jgi:hypothetical protein
MASSFRHHAAPAWAYSVLLAEELAVPEKLAGG